MSAFTTLPGLIDPHVHLRDPGQTHKEDFFTGTSAALAGGFTTVLDMPNNTKLIDSEELLEEKVESAQRQTVCDIGFHFGTLGDNTDVFPKIRDKVFGLKLYLNLTTGAFLLDSSKLQKVYEAWDCEKPILVHSHGEDDKLDDVVGALERTRQRTHIAHLCSAEELKLLINAKEKGLPITCGVTAHHLFLTNEDAEKLGPFAAMLPPLQSRGDVDFLWAHKDAIDMIESDHAPHTMEEKNSGKPPYGTPGLETTLPLLLTAVRDGRLTLDEVVAWCHTAPARVFAVPTDEVTKVVVDMDEEYEIQNESLKTKARWTPFAGRKVVGRVKQVDLRGETVYKDGQIIALPGSGRVLRDAHSS